MSNYYRNISAFNQKVTRLALILLCVAQCNVWANEFITPAIATASPYATEAGLEVLQKGGNAFDAAVAITAALAVVEPQHSGLGGGGFWLLYHAKSDKYLLIDGREKAPKSANARMYLNQKGEKIPDASFVGPLSSGIPGTVAAIDYINRHYSNRLLLDNLKPAIKYARDGIAVDKSFLYYIDKRRDALRLFTNSANLFLKNGETPNKQFRLIQTDLAVTLNKIGQMGKHIFYRGSVAKELVKSVKKAGGIWQLDDLADYDIVVRQPLIGTIQQTKIITTPPPSAGGIALITALNMLTYLDWKDFPRLEQLHIIVECMRRVYRDRALYIADTDFEPVPVERLISKNHARLLAKQINMDQATKNRLIDFDVPNQLDKQVNNLEHSTTHFSVIDKEGNMVSATLTINYPFGSGFIAGNTGVLLNNEMDDFTTQIGMPNAYGLFGSSINQIKPGKRPLSSMSPTIIQTKHRTAIFGTPGGSRIPTMVLLSTLSFMDGKPPKDWVSLSRFHHQFSPDVVWYEKNAFSEAEIKGLRAKGHHLKMLDRPYGNMQAVMLDKRTNKTYAVSDPRQNGLAVSGESDT